MSESRWNEELIAALRQAADLTTGYVTSDISKPAGHTADDIRQWIWNVCNQLEVTSTELAKASNVAPSTINRFLATSSGEVNLSAATIGKVTRAIKAYLGEGNSQLKHGSAVISAAVASVPPSSFVYPIFVVGAIDQSTRSIAFFWPKNHYYEIKVPLLSSSRFPINEIGEGEALIGLELLDNSMSLYYQKTSIIVAGTILKKENIDFRRGDHLVCFQEDQTGVRVLLRELAIDPQGDAWLVSRERNPEANEKAIFLGRSFQNPEVRIVAIVRASIQPHPNSLAETRPEDLRTYRKFEPEG